MWRAQLVCRLQGEAPVIVERDMGGILFPCFTYYQQYVLLHKGKHTYIMSKESSSAVESFIEPLFALVV